MNIEARLRAAAAAADDIDTRTILHEAAVEIERLRNTISVIARSIETLQSSMEELQREVDAFAGASKADSPR